MLFENSEIGGKKSDVGGAYIKESPCLSDTGENGGKIKKELFMQIYPDEGGKKAVQDFSCTAFVSNLCVFMRSTEISN